MAPRRYTVETTIRRPIDEVFRFCSDVRNEAVWNPTARRIDKLTDGPIGVGTRFLADWTNAPATVVEVAEYDPPRHWATHSRSLGLDVRVSGRLTDGAAGTTYVVEVQAAAGGIGSLIAPLALWLMRRQEPTNMSRIKRALEARDGTEVQHESARGLRVTVGQHGRSREGGG